MGDAPIDLSSLRTPAEHPLCEAFRVWLVDQEYDDAVEVCPVEGGEYLFATSASDLIDDFLDEKGDADPKPVFTDDDLEVLRCYAAELGYISDFASGDES